ncbi:MAG: YihY/virulence factor BrkB family protein [Desulfopila sp.]|jgi:membrane protein|nr:YihY/virulence factor BrkB family protein [Desulfopila sp.]
MPFSFPPTRLIQWADGSHAEQPRFHRILHTVLRVILITAHHFKKNELSLRAAALTFTVMLSLVPILAMSTAVIKGFGGGDQLKEVVYSYVATLDGGTSPAGAETDGQTEADNDTVDSSLPQHLYSAIDKLFAYVERTNFATLGTFGVAGIILSVILVLGNIEMAMNSIWHVESGRSLMRKVSDYLALIVLMPISINVGLASSAVLTNEALLSKFSVLIPMVWIQAIILKLLPIFFLALTLYVIYLFFPNTKVKTIPAMIGAVFAGYFWFEAQNIYISLQVGVSKYNAIYGSFATLPLFLVWVYFGWIFILTGAQIAYAVQNRDTMRLLPRTTPPSLKLAIAYDVLEYVQQKFDMEEKASLDDFLHAFPMHSPETLQQTVDLLREADLIHWVDDQTSMKPSIPGNKLDHSRIIKAIIGSTYGETKGGEKSCEVLNAASVPLSKTHPTPSKTEEL